jgi:hypothetical protein
MGPPFRGISINCEEVLRFELRIVGKDLLMPPETAPDAGFSEAQI